MIFENARMSFGSCHASRTSMSCTRSDMFRHSVRSFMVGDSRVVR